MERTEVRIEKDGHGWKVVTPAREVKGFPFRWSAEDWAQRNGYLLPAAQGA